MDSIRGSIKATTRTSKNVTVRLHKGSYEGVQIQKDREFLQLLSWLYMGL